MKNLKSTFSILVFATLAVAHSTSLAKGGTDGGGGTVVKCEVLPQVIPKTVNGKIKLELEFDKKLADAVRLSHGRIYQLTDLWEAERGYGPFKNHKINMIFDQTNSVDVQIQQALNRLYALNPQFADLVRKNIDIVRKNYEVLPPTDYILDPQDTDIRAMTRGCALTTLGRYSDRENNLVLDPLIWPLFKKSKTDEAAFWMHEAIYKTLREAQGDQDSWRTRKMVGLLFSVTEFTWADFR